MIGQARIAYPAIIMQGQDFYSALAPYLISIEYTDNCDGERADDLTIELADRDKRFISDWAPVKGAFFDVSIKTERWFSPISPTLVLDCGRFWIDTIEFHMPDNTVVVKACSLPSTAHLKATDESKPWTGHTLSEIAQEISDDNKMGKVVWEASIDPEIEQVEQDDENALQFLQKQIKKAKLSLKIHRNKIVVFDEEAYEAKPAAFTILYGNGPTQAGVPVYYMAGGNLQTRLIDTAAKARLVVTDPETGEATNVEVGEGEAGAAESPSSPSEGSGGLSVMGLALTPPSETVDPGVTNQLITTPLDSLDVPMLNLNAQLDFEAAAPDTFGQPQPPPVPIKTWAKEAGDWEGELLAKAALRERNKRRFTGEIDLAMGNPIIAAGMTCNLVGLGQYDGKWFVVSAAHRVGPTFTTSLIIRRCLTGY